MASLTTTIRDHLIWRYFQARYLLADENVTRRVGETAATFDVGSFREYLRVVDFQEESFTIEALIDAVRDNDVFWDVGANIGTHACYVGKHAERVVAVEPHSETARRTRRNFRLNDVFGEVIECALGAEPGRDELQHPKSDTEELGIGKFSLVAEDGYDTVHEIDIETGDDLVESRGVPLPDVLKVDVEGAELDVLAGFQDGLRNAHTVLVEIHPRFVDPDSVSSLLREHGFQLRTLRERSGELHVIGQ